MEKYIKQQNEIDQIIKNNSNRLLPAIPNCLGSCDECKYRAEEWEKILGEKLVNEEGEPLFFYE